MEEIVEKRKFRVTGISNRELEEKIRNCLSALNGVKSVEVDATGRLSLEYDLMKVKLKGIDTVLADIGHPPAGGFRGRIFRAWIHFTEKNKYDNMRASAAPCCSNPKTTPNRDRL